MKTSYLSKICGLAMMFPLTALSQNTIVGTVENELHEPMIGVKITIEETFLKTLSDNEGKYKFKGVKNGDYVLSFHYLGYELQQVKVHLEGNKTEHIKVVLQTSAQMVEEVVVTAIRADEKTPTTYSNIGSLEVEKNNFGQDIPYLLDALPSTVVTSDAGAGVGYTGIRIRGVDPSRTNVTINGIPINDSESHGVYWVNMPDLASSIDNIQVQRGVGTSTNGAAAFGASINIKTNRIERKAYANIDNSYGSFNTWKNSIKAGTGLINKKFTVDMRLSSVRSEGYIDRASSNLKSYYVSGAWVGNKSILRATVFSGKEITYQAWYGTPESVIKGNQAEIIAYANRNYIFGEDRNNLLTAGRTYNYYTYENEVDNYKQSHYQMHFDHRFNAQWKLSTAIHYTKGAGYYEQFKKDQDFNTYGFSPIILTNDTINRTDLIRRRWLDNDFYGAIVSVNHKKKGLDLTIGGAVNHYEGGHFGEVIWAKYASNSDIRDRYYDNDANKLEANAYAKATYKFKKYTFFGDVQYRHIEYSFLGIDDVNGTITAVDQNVKYDFINPKAGLMYDFNAKNNAYLSVAIANREPVRRDFRESTPANRPKHENLTNVEAGYRFKGNSLFVNANFYWMNYKNQLVLTGQINDVGGYTRTNVEKSYRSGIELEAGYIITKKIQFAGNVTLSQNKIKSFNEFVDNYDVGGQDTIAHSNTDLAFSPNIIASLALSYEPIKNLSITLTGKHVGDQFLDNTSTSSRKLDAYITSNLQVNYSLKEVVFKEVVFGLLVNNVFDAKYENNGYTWGYVYGGQRTVENFYYPQAGRNFLVRILLKM